MKKYADIVSLFLIFLIVMIPMNSSVVMGATINSVQVYGTQKILDYRAQTDVTVVNVSVMSPEDPDLSPSQVKVLEDPTRPFECTVVDEATASFECINEYPETTLPADYGLLQFTVQVFNDAGAPASPPRQGVVTIDALPPKVLGVNYSAKPGGVVEATFDVQDVACDDPACSMRCAGVGSLKFTVAGLAVGQNNSFGAGCHHIGTLNLTGLTVGGEKVTKHICIEVMDKLGQSATECRDVEIDTKAPYISGIGLTDLNGNPIEFTNGQPRGNVNVVINITEDSDFFNPIGGNEFRLQVNASALSERPDHQQVFGSQETDLCTPLGDNRYTCKVGGLYLIASTPRTISIGVIAKDVHENILNESKSIAITFDNTPPVATKIYSNYFDADGTYWVREENNTITMDISESGSGMVRSLVYLDFASFGEQNTAGGAAAVAASECGSGNCVWNLVRVVGRASGSRVTASPVLGSKDAAGNALQPVTGVFRVDTDKPDMIYVNVTPLGETEEIPYVTSGDMLKINVYVEDFTPITALGNFTKIVPEEGHGADEGTCVKFEGVDEDYSAFIAAKRAEENGNLDKTLWDCSWEVGPIFEVDKELEHLWTNTTVYFNFTDLLDHTVEEDYDEIEILGEENITADYWQFEWEDQSPSMGLDRFIWGLGLPSSYQMFTVTSPYFGSEVKMISFEIDPTSCVGDIDYLYYSDTGAAGVSYMNFDPDISDGIDDIILVEFNAANAPPAEYVTEENDTYPLDWLYVNCTAFIRSIISDARISTVEEENITLKVSVFNNPLGENIGNVKDEMERMEDVLGNDWWGIIRYPKIILDYAELICGLVNTLNQLRGIWTLVSEGMGAACEGSGIMCGASGGSNALQGELNDQTEGLIGKILTFCGLVISCRATTPGAIDGAERQTDSSGQLTNEYECPDDNGWCKFQLAWSTWNNKVIGALSGGSFLGEGKSRQLATTTRTLDDGTEITENAGGFNAFRNISFADQSALRGSFDVKKSLISSVLTGCLPGIFDGIDKYRQLGCEWLLCYKVNVAYGAMTMDQCDQQFNYGICRYVLGEVWNVVPFYQYANELMGMVRDILGDPFILIGYAIDLGCSLGCAGTPGSGCAFCTVMEFINVASQIAASIAGVASGDAWSAPLHDICEVALEEEPSYSDLAGFPPEADPASEEAAVIA